MKLTSKYHYDLNNPKYLMYICCYFMCIYKKWAIQMA